MAAEGGAEMSVLVLGCGKVFEGLSDTLTGPVEILVGGNRIARIERSVGRPPGVSSGSYAADGNEAVPYSPAAFQFRS
jgi:hypothetical protein